MGKILFLILSLVSFFAWSAPSPHQTPPNKTKANVESEPEPEAAPEEAPRVVTVANPVVLTSEPTVQDTSNTKSEK